jgi:hypothetical protein
MGRLVSSVVIVQMKVFLLVFPLFLFLCGACASSEEGYGELRESPPRVSPVLSIAGRWQNSRGCFDGSAPVLFAPVEVSLFGALLFLSYMCVWCIHGG